MIIDEKEFRENGYSYKKRKKFVNPISHNDSWRLNVQLRYGGYCGFLTSDGLTYVW